MDLPIAPEMARLSVSSMCRQKCAWRRAHRHRALHCTAPRTSSTLLRGMTHCAHWKHVESECRASEQKYELLARLLHGTADGLGMVHDMAVSGRRSASVDSTALRGVDGRATESEVACYAPQAPEKAKCEADDPYMLVSTVVCNSSVEV